MRERSTDVDPFSQGMVGNTGSQVRNRRKRSVLSLALKVKKIGIYLQIINFDINDVAVNSLVDSGSTVSLLSPDLFDSLKYEN